MPVEDLLLKVLPPRAPRRKVVESGGDPSPTLGDEIQELPVEARPHPLSVPRHSWCQFYYLSPSC